MGVASFSAMDDDQEMESSPMETVYSWSEHSKESKNNYKRKYQEDSGYTTTPSSSQSTCGIGFTLGISSDEGFSESPRFLSLFYNVNDLYQFLNRFILCCPYSYPVFFF